MAIAAGVGFLLVAAFLVARIGNPQPLPGEWLFPLRGRWLRIILTATSTLLAWWLLGFCATLSLVLPAVAVYYSYCYVCTVWLAPAATVGSSMPARADIRAAEGSWRTIPRLAAIGAYAVILWMMMRPWESRAVSPDGSLTARMTSPGLLVTMIYVRGERSIALPFTRYGAEITDNRTNERMVLLDREQPQDWFKDWREVSLVKWRPDSRRVSFVFRTGISAEVRAYILECRPLRATPFEVTPAERMKLRRAADHW